MAYMLPQPPETSRTRRDVVGERDGEVERRVAIDFSVGVIDASEYWRRDCVIRGEKD